MTSDLGGLAMLADGGALVGLRHGLHRLDLQSGKLALWAPPPFDPSLFRFNEGACDARGRLSHDKQVALACHTRCRISGI